MLSLNILDRPLTRLLMDPLEFNQAAPPGFLLVQWVLVRAFGASEYIFRLYPLLCSVAALFLATLLGLRLTSSTGLVVLIGLLAICQKLVYFASEAKQYSSDVVVTLVVVLLALRTRSRGLTRSDLVLLGVVGAGAIWFSHPAIFVLAGVGLYVGLLQFQAHRRAVTRLAFVFVPWLASAAAFQFLVVSRATVTELMQNYWKAYFAPFPPASVDDLRWYLYYPFHVFEDPLSLHFSGLAAFLFAAGCVSYASSREHRLDLMLFVSPIGFALIGSMVHLYPFGVRLLLFLVPLLSLLIAHGVASLSGAGPRKVVAAAAAGLLFLHPTWDALYRVARPTTVQEVRPVIEEMQRTFRQGDRIYVHKMAAPAFQFYAPKYGLDMSRATLESDRVGGRPYLEEWSTHLSKGDRCWLVFALEPWRDQQVIAEYRRALEGKGREISTASATGASAYLFVID
jgi:hypothetical protein